MSVFGLTPEQLVVISAAFGFGCWCTALQFRLRRAARDAKDAQRIAKKAHVRLDRYTGTDWVTSGAYRALTEEDLE